MLDWKILEPYYSHIAGISVIIILAFIASLLVGKLFKTIKEKARFSEHAMDNTRSAARWLIFMVAFLFILQQFGVKVSTLLSTLLAVAGLIAVGFIAVWSILSNFLCALLLVIFKPFQIGDDIEVAEVIGGAGLRGKILKFNIMYTTLVEEIDGEEVVTIIPNNIFFQKAIRKRYSDDSSEN